MKGFSFSFFNIFSTLIIILLLVTILVPFKLINMEQAERIAKWKTVYEDLKYSFNLVNLHEGNIVPNLSELDKIFSDDDMFERIKPYLNFENNEYTNPYNRGYFFKNATPVKKHTVFFFDKFIEIKNGVLVGIKKNYDYVDGHIKPEYIMFVDINGKYRPNLIGQDIFFIGVYSNEVMALGKNVKESLKANCSILGNGVYCSEYYLMGGQL